MIDSKLKGIHEEIEKFNETMAVKMTNEEKAHMTDTMYKTLQYSSNIVWENQEDVFLVKKPNELLEIYTLRSKIYKNMGYNKEFPDTIQGINFDHFDENSAVLYTKTKGKITGACRIIFDSGYKLPIDNNFSLEYIRRNECRLAELSRLMIVKEKKGMNMEFKYLTAGVYNLMVENKYDKLISVIKDEHFSLYNKFGGFEKEAAMETYGELENPFIITVWNISKISTFFKKVFLGRRGYNLTPKSRNSFDKLAS